MNIFVAMKLTDKDFIQKANVVRAERSGGLPDMKKYLFHSIMIGLIFIGLTACAKQKKNGPLLQGRALEKEGEYLAALDHYKKMKNDDFRQDNIQNLYYLYGDILEAMQAINSGDPSAEQYYQLGEAYHEKAQSVPDMAAIEPNRELDLDNYFKQQREQFQGKALTALNIATDMQPSHLEALWIEGQLHEERGETDLAILAYQKMLQSDSRSVGILSKSEADLANVASEESGIRQRQSKAMARLGRLIYEQGEHENGMALVKQAIFLEPQNTEAYFSLGELYARQGDSPHAIMQYEAALCTDPAYLEAYYRIARIYLLRSEAIEAERVLKLGRLNNPDASHLGLFHSALKETLDRQEQDKAQQIIQQLEGDLGSDDLGKLDVSGQSYRVQLLYYNLRLQLLQRQRPYWLACGSIEEHPYFITQINRTQAKINSIEKILKSAEK